MWWSDAYHRKPKSEGSDNGQYGESDGDWQRENSEKDLIAQDSMAKSTSDIRDFTETITSYTFWGLLISGSGLLLLGYNILQNRATFEHIQRASAEELKPYFKLGLASSPDGRSGERHKFSYIIKFNLENIGKTPAYNLRDFRITTSQYTYQTDTLQEYEPIEYLPIDTALITDSVRVIDPENSTEIVFAVGFEQVGGWELACPEWYDENPQVRKELYNHPMPLTAPSDGMLSMDYNFTLQYVFNDISAPEGSKNIRVHEIKVAPSPVIHDELRVPVISMHRDQVISERDLAKENRQK